MSKKLKNKVKTKTWTHMEGIQITPEKAERAAGNLGGGREKEGEGER